MIEIKTAESRGKTETNWLESFHSFSFGDYYDPENKRFSSLRVINDDYIKAGAGFDFHPHSNMEIFTFMSGLELILETLNQNIIKRKPDYLVS